MDAGFGNETRYWPPTVQTTPLRSQPRSAFVPAGRPMLPIVKSRSVMLARLPRFRW